MCLAANSRFGESDTADIPYPHEVRHCNVVKDLAHGAYRPCLWGCGRTLAAHRALYIDPVNVGGHLMSSIAVFFWWGCAPCTASAMAENPSWVRHTAQRISEGRRLESPAVGHERWQTAADLVRNSRIAAGIPGPAAAAESATAETADWQQHMVEDWRTVSRDLATAAAAFEPQRYTMIVAGRPTQALHHNISSAFLCLLTRARRLFLRRAGRISQKSMPYQCSCKCARWQSHGARNKHITDIVRAKKVSNRFCSGCQPNSEREHSTYT